MSIYLQIKSIFFNWMVTPIFPSKMSIFRRQSLSQVIVCLKSWRNHQGMLSLIFIQTVSIERNLY